MLKVSPWKGTIRFRKRGKLSPRFLGPFVILEKIGLQAYRLDLPPKMDGIHPTFHSLQTVNEAFRTKIEGPDTLDDLVGDSDMCQGRVTLLQGVYESRYTSSESDSDCAIGHSRRSQSQILYREWGGDHDYALEIVPLALSRGTIVRMELESGNNNWYQSRSKSKLDQEIQESLVRLCVLG
ncbi:hypothetical protein L6452_25714 [Arctium lappa]|uniref:Uncharacterized protein n=1 Tax=Arctium lappa TaxID=4217 RepID=A0ACB9ABS0_ARCLA|nr:hypothetical protein L6452_25714 [Arctium lappa]